MFEGINFDGQFRTYQQSILDNAKEYLKDGKIHIVAAPGSGKTILGLELIRRLSEPCLILSPTTTIRNQWGDRFAQHFLNGRIPEEFISYDLRKLKPLTSVTYQAMHAALKGLTDEEDGADYSSFYLIEEVKRYGIKTVCLDEAHHLQNEWQKALEAFLSELNGTVKIIALTATPPYDAKPTEWSRYTGVCGEIDEEIFVPELVKQNSLCPHQDFIYFNYPTDEEADSFNAYRERAAKALEELLLSDRLKTAGARLYERKRDYDFLYTNAENLINLLALLGKAGIENDKKLIRNLTCGKPLPSATPENMSAAVNYLIKGELLDEADREYIAGIFKRNGVTERGEVCLCLNEKLKRALVSSAGKLKSISEIVTSENASRGEDLRMLILTDFIKKDGISFIGSDKKPDAVSVVSVFETVRKTGVCAAALSGSLVILPDKCAKTLQEYGVYFTSASLGDTGYSAFEFRVGNREKVRIVSTLFEQNAFRVLVGTKSLLGEGWDAPCVNSLILASFVGSFMLSNQMRGRAIRTDKDNPDKTANVWHLVTLERPALYEEGSVMRVLAAVGEDKDRINSCDYETVTRRFDCFVAPNYDTGEIENGISRITVIKPPFDRAGIDKINSRTLELSAKGGLKEVWQNAVKNSARLNEVSSVPNRKRAVPPFLFVNLLTAALLLSLNAACIVGFIQCAKGRLFSDGSANTAVGVLALIACVALLIWLFNLITTKILKHLNPQRSIHTLCDCIMRAMQDAELISPDVRLVVDGVKTGVFVHIELANASVHDQNLFHTAVAQLLSPIESPRYLLIPRRKSGGLNFRCALACPEILGSKKEYAELLASRLEKSTGRIATVYTRTESGRKLIMTCRRKSYISRNEAAVYGSRHISNY